jgi:hypothetical protein
MLDDMIIVFVALFHSCFRFRPPTHVRESVCVRVSLIGCQERRAQEGGLEIETRHPERVRYAGRIPTHLPPPLPPPPRPTTHSLSLTDSAEEVWGDVHDFLSFLLITLMRTRRWKF